MSKAKIWLLATRPKTLPAGLAPVLIGSALAMSEGVFDGFLFAVTMLCALLIQICTNFINEIYDYKKGADTKERIGPKRHVASGDISPGTMRNVSIVMIIITFLLGMILVYHAGWPILAVGLLSLFFAYAYTGGPFPLAYKGLGDIFVFVFFGLIAAAGTFYVQTLSLTYESIIAGIAPGAFSMNILGVNNIRDIATDPKAGKITLAVRIGKALAMALYVFNNLLAYASTIALYIMLDSIYLLLPLLTLPISVVLIKKLYTKTGRDLNPVLEGAGKLLLLHGILTVAGLLI